MLTHLPIDLRLPRHDGQRVLTPHLQLRATVPRLLELQLHVRVRARRSMQDRREGRARGLQLRRRLHGQVGGLHAGHHLLLPPCGMGRAVGEEDVRQVGELVDLWWTRRGSRSVRWWRLGMPRVSGTG